MTDVATIGQRLAALKTAHGWLRATTNAAIEHDPEMSNIWCAAQEAIHELNQIVDRFVGGEGMDSRLEVDLGLWSARLTLSVRQLADRRTAILGQDTKYPGETRDLMNMLDYERQRIAHETGIDNPLFAAVNEALRAGDVARCRDAMTRIEAIRQQQDGPAEHQEHRP